jgi:hypothetical protein
VLEKTTRCANCHEIVRRVGKRSAGFIGAHTEFAHYSNGCSWGKQVTYDQTYDEEQKPPNPLPTLPCDTCGWATSHAYFAQRRSPTNYSEVGYEIWYRCRTCSERRIWGTTQYRNVELEATAVRAGLL